MLSTEIFLTSSTGTQLCHIILILLHYQPAYRFTSKFRQSTQQQNVSETLWPPFVLLPTSYCRQDATVD